ncbi:sn-glycerol-3-phosphate transport system permease protein UgpE [Marinobacterium zhoushanense]|uniref:sn-glycerol-3-phosphate transport system permease protein UgpE n=1 Tax=Marinobacterium zhoushanense TaxID=1679163 RepID=A0ABQ1KBE3_9GAMM|nr:carbohydrate ABC transporter permease [Marinobacterium zhoushanense]GGB93675.1 sn-glycerol-3-phosphate transport system permease protein UgpE [Marinobacterium zhoushanense]
MTQLKKLGWYLLLLAIGYVFLFPLLFMLVSSLKPEQEIFADLYSIRAILPVGELSLENYRQVFAKSDVLLYFRNSVLITSATVVLGLFVNSLLAFTLSRMEWSGRKYVLSAVIALMIIPLEAIVVPLLLLVSKLPTIGWEQGVMVLKSSWLNTLEVQILPFVANSFFIFLFYQFFRDIPKDFDEAAELDGATPFQIYRHIIVPMSGPVFATVAILHFLLMWNQYIWPIMAVQGEDARPVMPGIQIFFGRQVGWGEIMAYASFVTLPVLAVFLAFQKMFVRSLAGAGIKG